MPRTAEPDGTADERSALARLIRDDGARVLATLIRTTGSWQLAEDAVQDAVVRALQTWSRDGVPPQPRAWLTVTARHCAVDLIRREAMRPGKETEAIAALTSVDDAPLDSQTTRDDMLRLLFTCCHPSLPIEAQSALALRTLCGLTTSEVASALLVSESTMARRLARAKRKIAVAGIPYRTPSAPELPRRLSGVLTTVYLLFNEGYHATAGESPLRRNLTSEAIRLADLLHELLPHQVRVVGLRALLHLQEARSDARVDDGGGLVRLCDQDRALWDADQIGLGLSLLGVALRHPTEHPDPYTVQAAIAACHDLAPAWEQTNWAAIVSWYDVLVTVADTPVVQLNRAVAVGELHGAVAGLVELDRIDGLADYLPFVAARAEQLARAGRRDEARAAFRAALDLPGNEAAKRGLAVRLGEL